MAAIGKCQSNSSLNSGLTLSPQRSSRCSAVPKLSPTKVAIQPIDGQTYLKLLKKSEMINHLQFSMQESEKLKNDCSALQGENEYAGQMNAELQRQLMEANEKNHELEKMFMLHLIDLEQMFLKQEALQLGHSETTATSFAYDHAKLKLREDMIQTGYEQSVKHLGHDKDCPIEHSAMAIVAKTKLVQIEKFLTKRNPHFEKQTSTPLSINSILTGQPMIIEDQDEAYQSALERQLRITEREKVEFQDQLYNSEKHQSVMHTELLAIRERLQSMAKNREHATLHSQIDVASTPSKLAPNPSDMMNLGIPPPMQTSLYLDYGPKPNDRVATLMPTCSLFSRDPQSDYIAARMKQAPPSPTYPADIFRC